MNKIYKRICNECGKDYTGSGKFFCSHKCSSAKKRIGKFHTEESKKKMRENHVGNLGRKFSEEIKAKMRQVKLGKNNPMFGRKGKKNPLWGTKRSGEVVKKCSKTFFKKGSIPWNAGKKTGIKPGNWKGGIISEDRIFKSSAEYKKWRFEVFKRDNFSCLKCGAHTLKGIEGIVKLEAHHIYNFIDNISLRIKIKNGATFCKNCHNHFHKKYGFRNNDYQQFQEFLSNYEK
jgi:hypothetical protein